VIFAPIRKLAPALAAAGRSLERLRVWLRDDDGSWREGAPRPFLLFLLIFGAGIGLVSLLGDQGWVAYRRLQQEESGLRAELRHLERESVELAQKVQALKSDPQYIEMLARQRLGLVKPGETVIELNTDAARRP